MAYAAIGLLADRALSTTLTWPVRWAIILPAIALLGAVVSRWQARRKGDGKA